MVETIRLKSFIFLFLLSLSACSTIDSNRRIYITDSDYKSTILEVSKSTQTYDGLVNTIDVRATLMTSKVREAQTLRKATNFQWTEAEVIAEREYQQKSSAAETKIFMSFYTPEAKDDNLHKVDTVWRIFLDVEGKRYAGTVQKMSDSVTEVRDLYPDHTKWGTPYIIKFLVPTSISETNPSLLTLTGPVGSATLNF